MKPFYGLGLLLLWSCFTETEALSLQYNCTESFSFYSSGTTQFFRYQNFSIKGNKKWQIKEYYGNTYLEMSAYRTKEDNHAIFAVPLSSDYQSISFSSKEGYDKGSVLRVYLSEELPSSQNHSTWKDISSFFEISSGKSRGYARKFLFSGDYDLEKEGAKWLIFEYRGSSSGITTTMQLDDLKVVSDKCKG